MIVMEIKHGLNGVVNEHLKIRHSEDHRDYIVVYPDVIKPGHQAHCEPCIHELCFCGVDGEGDLRGGLTNEALLTIVKNRLDHFQKGDFACQENAVASSQIQCALDELRRRTERRAALGIEGSLIGEDSMIGLK